MQDFKSLGVADAFLGFLEKRNITRPTAIQRAAMPRIMAGGSLIGTAPTGTGKTLAYLLPLLARLDSEAKGVQAVVLAPTYELAMQIANEAREIIAASGMALHVQGLIGGANIARQIEKLKDKPQLIVGSAGRLLELVRRNKLKLSEVRVLVLDEFDRLLDDQNLGNTADLVRLLPPVDNLQVLLFSATAPKKAMERASFLGQPELVAVQDEPLMQGQRSDLYRITPFREKIEVLRKLARRLQIKRGLVFIGKRFDVEKALSHLNYEGLLVESLVSENGKQARQHAVDAFRKGKVQLLLATDVAARGLDIPEIDYVINLDVPENAQAYQHRAGRTARAGASGTVITLADIKEAYKLQKLEKQLGLELKPLEPNGKAMPRQTQARKPHSEDKAKERQQAKASSGGKSKPYRKRPKK